MPEINEWYDQDFLKKMNFLDWKSSLLKMHKDINKEDVHSNVYRRLAYDEIFSHLLVLSENIKKIKKVKMKSKSFNKKIFNDVVCSLNFKLTKDQERCIEEIDKDLKSKIECLEFYKEM